LRGGSAHHLTPKLFELLMLLAAGEGKIVYRKTIMKKVWETDYMGDTRTLDVHIRWLRQKIEENPARPRHLLTVRGAGYRFFAYP
jgi:DNA-binding response OmpR family regulator